MIRAIEIKNVISKRRIKKVMKYLTNSKTEYFDGRRTASGLARLGKNTWQVDKKQIVDGIKCQDFLNEIWDWIKKSNKFINEFSLELPVVPKWNLIQMYDSKFKANYDWHVDNPVSHMGDDYEYTQEEYATLSNTHAMSLVLNDDYEGGEFEIREPDGSIQKFKARAGSLIIFPTTNLHRVLPVTSGTRFAFVQWINLKCSNYEDYLLYASYKQLHNIISQRINWSVPHPDGTPKDVSDVVKSFNDRVKEGIVDEEEWVLGVSRMMIALRNQLIKKTQS